MLSYREYFEAEMRSLQDLAQEFADAYPEQASMLNLNAIKDRDPYVERLLEGMAFLTSQVRLRLDDSVPEISERLLDQIMPTMVRPYPANTIIQLSPNVQNKEAITIPENSLIKALNVGPINANCTFTTTHSVSIQPVIISSVISSEKIGGGCQVRITYRKGSQANWADIDLGSIKLYLSADWPLAYSLFYVLTDQKTKIQLDINGRSHFNGAKPIVLRGAHQTAKDSLLPVHGRSHSAFSLMHDYFCAREKYLFVESKGLDDLNIDEAINEITLVVDSSISLPVDTKLTADNLKPYCVPAINLYEEDAEPILVDHSKSEYRVTPDRQVAEFSSIYSVIKVSSRDQSNGETYFYSPLHAMKYRQKDDRVYSTNNRTAGIDKRITYISLNSSPPFTTEVVSLETLITNDQYPRQYVEIGSATKLDDEYTRQVNAANVTRPSKMLHAPTFQDYQWQLVSLLSLNLSSLESVDHIKQLLSLFDWSGQLDNQRKIESVVDIRTSTTHRIRRGILFQGLEVSIELNESGFSSIADMYLFGSVLHNFFSAFASMTEFVQTRVIQLPSYKEWTWSPVFGNKALF